MKQKILILAALTAFACCRPKDPVAETASRIIEVARSQYMYMDTALDADRYPRSSDKDGNLIATPDVGWWCSGFHPGSLWYIYEYTGDGMFKDMAWRYTDRLDALLARDCDHDIGFQINCSYGNALRLTGDSLKVVPIYIAARHASTTLTNHFREDWT